jgi:hypothetical protein
MDSRLAAGAVAAFAFVLWGCSRAEEPRESRAAVRYRITEVGASDSAVELSTVGALGLGSEGSIYLADGQDRIVVLNPAGALQRVLGRSGAGPGEFALINDLRVLPGDSLMVVDPAQSRISIFQPNSSVLAQTRPLEHQPGELVIGAAPAADGRLLTHSVRAHGPTPDPQRRDDVVRSQDAAGAARAILALSPNEVLQMELRGAMGFFMPGFAPRRIVRLRDGKVYTAWTDSAVVRVFDANGRQVAAITPSALPARHPISAREYDSVAATFGDAALARRARPLVQARWRTWPLMHDMLVDDRGGVWIKPTRQPRNQWLHHDAAGAFVGSLELPDNAMPRMIVGDRVYCVVKDELDVPRVVVYALDPAPGGTAG